jgi:hypothetical protein
MLFTPHFSAIAYSYEDQDSHSDDHESHCVRVFHIPENIYCSTYLIHVLNPQANYTDRATAAPQRS